MQTIRSVFSKVTPHDVNNVGHSFGWIPLILGSGILIFLKFFGQFWGVGGELDWLAKYVLGWAGLIVLITHYFIKRPPSHSGFVNRNTGTIVKDFGSYPNVMWRTEWNEYRDTIDLQFIQYQQIPLHCINIPIGGRLYQIIVALSEDLAGDWALRKTIGSTHGYGTSLLDFPGGAVIQKKVAEIVEEKFYDIYHAHLADFNGLTNPRKAAHKNRLQEILDTHLSPKLKDTGIRIKECQFSFV